MPKKTHKNWTTKEVKEAIKLRQRGAPLKAIAKWLDRPFWSVAKKLAESNVRHPTRARLVSNQ